MKSDATDNTPLIIGIGNSLRGDDAVGPVVVDRFAADPVADGPCRTLTCHQLAPDHALDIASATGVIFVDASCELSPGWIDMRPIAAATGAPAIGHQLGPSHLLALAGAMFGAAPPAWTLAVGAASFEHGHALSDAVASAVAPMVDRLAAWLREHREACHA